MLIEVSWTAYTVFWSSCSEEVAHPRRRKFVQMNIVARIFRVKDETNRQGNLTLLTRTKHRGVPLHCWHVIRPTEFSGIQAHNFACASLRLQRLPHTCPDEALGCRRELRVIPVGVSGLFRFFSLDKFPFSTFGSRIRSPNCSTDV